MIYTGRQGCHALCGRTRTHEQHPEPGQHHHQLLSRVAGHVRCGGHGSGARYSLRLERGEGRHPGLLGVEQRRHGAALLHDDRVLRPHHDSRRSAPGSIRAAHRDPHRRVSRGAGVRHLRAGRVVTVRLRDRLRRGHRQRSRVRLLRYNPGLDQVVPRRPHRSDHRHRRRRLRSCARGPGTTCGVAAQCLRDHHHLGDGREGSLGDDDHPGHRDLGGCRGTVALRPQPAGRPPDKAATATCPGRREPRTRGIRMASHAADGAVLAALRHVLHRGGRRTHVHQRGLRSRKAVAGVAGLPGGRGPRRRQQQWSHHGRRHLGQDRPAVDTARRVHLPSCRRCHPVQAERRRRLRGR